MTLELNFYTTIKWQLQVLKEIEWKEIAILEISIFGGMGLANHNNT